MGKEDYNLERFVSAQKSAYPVAQLELHNGKKRSHWMWYIFPQLKQLGFSYNSKYYGISGLDEARAYLEHPELGKRLRELSEALLALDTNDAEEVFGSVDSLKLRSSMTLYDAVEADSVFARVLDKYFAGHRDPRTLALLGK